MPSQADAEVEAVSAEMRRYACFFDKLLSLPVADESVIHAEVTRDGLRAAAGAMNNDDERFALPALYVVLISR